jgi:hypothetical protein
MGALTADRNTQRKDDYLGLAAAVIYAGGMVAVDSSGLAQPCADSASLKFVGIARRYVDNSAGADKAVNVDVFRSGVFSLTSGSDLTAHIGELAYALDDESVDLTGNTQHQVKVGAISEIIDATHAWIDIERKA